MDFEVGAWQTSKKADDLNDKLFGKGVKNPSQDGNPLTGALAREEKHSKMKKKKKKEKLLVGEQRVKPNTREEALALAKQRKNHKRKTKQKLAQYQIKVQKATTMAESGVTPSPSKGKPKKPTKGKKGQEKSKSPNVNGKASQSETKSPGEKARKNQRNKYKHLATQKSEAVNIKSENFDTDTNIKSKHRFGTDVEESQQSPKTDVKPKKSPKTKHKNLNSLTESKMNVEEMAGEQHVIKGKLKNGKSVKTKSKKYEDCSNDESDTVMKRREGAFEDSPLEGAKEVMRRLKVKKRKSQDCSLIEADSKKVEVVDLQSPENEGLSKKKKKKRTSDETNMSIEPPRKKKHKRQESDDLVKLSLTGKPSTKDKFNLTKLNKMLGNRKPHGNTEQQQKRVDESPEKDSSKSLKQKMEAQLNSARFRFINEQLYTSTSEDAVAMMKEDPEAFNVYHQGFQSQVSKWPSNPLNLMISYLKQRPKSLVVADLGCGDGVLGESVKQKVYSFDLVSTKKAVIACDIADLPLDDDDVDISIFCLSLMGTNLVDFITEANRITKLGGTLLIAEVLSRFEKLGNFIRKMTKLGFTLISKDETNKMFVWMEFKKTGAPDTDRLPKLELAPCTYKKR